MSKSPTRPSNRKTDRTAAVTLEVPSGVADDIESVLRDYAEEAELDTSLVVDHSGYLIAGISSIPDVDVDTIGTLVAGACAATEGLTGSLGEAGRVESLHLGEDRLLYLKEVGERFILVGVSDSNIPAGILRDQANLIEPTLLKLLVKVKAIPMSLTNRPGGVKLPETKAKPALAVSLRQPDATPEPESVRPRARPVAASISTPVPGAGDKISGTIDPNLQVRSVGGVIPGAAQSSPSLKKDPIPDSVFEFDEADAAESQEHASPVAPKRVEPHAVVENSPFEMDDGDDDEINFKPVRPNTTPVHLSVPAARQKEAAARQERDDDDDHQSGRHYSFELG